MTMTEPYTDTPILTLERFDSALQFAVEHHRRQLRKGTEIPYVAHILAVTALVLEMGGDEDEAIGALLHDVVEDGGGPDALARIRREFGARVADIVEANTDTDEIPKPPWHERKARYIAGIAQKAPDAMRVSLADKLHNARAILLDTGPTARLCGRASRPEKAPRCGGTTVVAWRKPSSSGATRWGRQPHL
jgi:(p)ppGpp synthase/HD superfamily hydrolase